MTRLMDTVRFRKLGIVRGRGALLEDIEGKTYIDFFTDVGTASLGYMPDQMHRALAKISQSGLIHCPILFQQTFREETAELFCKLVGMDRVFFCNSGAEAAEAAIKLVRKHWHATKSKFSHLARTTPTIWTAEGGFHGRTLATLAAGDSPPHHVDGYQPLPSGFLKFRHVNEIPPSAAGVMLAPVLGNNDVRPYPTQFLRDLRGHCDKHSIPLIFDEVQTGAGRTGAISYAQKIGVIPDVITFGKGIAMGAPVGAMLARGEIATMFTPGTHFSTFGGNPLCCAFLRAMLDWLAGYPLIHFASISHFERIEHVGKQIEAQLKALDRVKAVRREGMLIAADIYDDTVKVAEGCERRGLLLGAFRSGPGPLKITPPLNIDDEELNTGMRILTEELGG